ncbi:MAG: Crp/Fnr family transcriptional regulator [Flavobacterium sp.]
MTIEPLFKYISDFINVSDKDVRLLRQSFKYANFSKGSILEKENTVAQKLYFIKSGFLRTFYIEEGTEITTQIVRGNSFITGFNSFVTGEFSNVTVQCISDCEVLYIIKADYDRLTTDIAAWSTFCKHVYEDTLRFSLQRTTDLLSLSAEKRYLKLLEEQPEVIKNVPIQYIASYIGIKPESLSRIRRKIIS